VLSLRPSGRRPPPSRWNGWLALLAATSATCGSLVALLVALYHATSGSKVVTFREAAPSERIVLVIPRVEQPSDRVARQRSTSVTIPPAPRTATPPPSDTASTRTSAPTSAPNPTSASAPLSIDAVSRLARPRPGPASMFGRPDARDPFAPPAPLTLGERDSVLHALETMTPELAAQRVPTRAEVDAAAKEATLKMRLSGRTLLVPPDNSGGLIVARIPLPRLRPGPSKAARARDRRADDEGQARLRRLLARADAARRARQDSVERSAARDRENP
jgi:hypothetical protein